MSVASLPDTLTVRRAARLRGSPALPGDKSVSHRALLLALLGDGESRITGASDGEDVGTTARAVERLGAGVERLSPSGERLGARVERLGATVARSAVRPGRVDYVVTPPTNGEVQEPDGILDCGNSGTTARLLAGLLAGRPLFAVLDGDASLRRRPMGRVVEPLRAMGAVLTGRGGGTLLPLALMGQSPLRPIDHRSRVPSAQVKSAILLAALAADGETTVSEPVATRDHTERMLRARGVAVAERVADDGRHVVTLRGPARPRAVNTVLPADPSAAAFWLVAAAAHPDAELRLAGVSTNPTRRAIIDLLRRMGADIDERPLAATGGADLEPQADLVVRSSRLRAIEVSAAEVAAAIDDIPVLALAAAVADGTTRIRGAGELRHKESDRVAGIASGLSALGARVWVDGDDLEIGGGGLRGAIVESRGDHRLAMTFAVAGLLADGETIVCGPSSAAISDPGFFRELEGVRA